MLAAEFRVRTSLDRSPCKAAEIDVPLGDEADPVSKRRGMRAGRKRQRSGEENDGTA